MDTAFTAITPTGDRPVAFRLCQLYMSRQTIKPVEWIVIDDGRTPLEPPKDIPFLKYIRRERQPSDPIHTLRLQMIEALKYVTTERVLIMEDDDWYDPNYFNVMLGLLKEYDLVGQGDAVYYHIIHKRYHFCKNKGRASWCQTGFRSFVIPKVVRICQLGIDPFLDLSVWRIPDVRKRVLLGERPLCVGIKGLPGRQGTTMGWTHPLVFTLDVDGKMLPHLIGEDSGLYSEFQGVKE